MKIRPVGAELFHADGRTDMTKLIVPFRNFVNAPKKRVLQNCLPIPYSEHVQLNLQDDSSRPYTFLNAIRCHPII
jgi:hypothetical protein